MIPDNEWKALGWRHPIWDLLRYYCSLRSSRQKADWVRDLRADSSMSVGGSDQLPVAAEDVTTFCRYLELRDTLLQEAFACLRTEKNALAYCERLGVVVGTTRTKSTDHHQASKALVGAVTFIAQQFCQSKGLTVEANPQRRCVWCDENGLHVTARNLDGAIPTLSNPRVIWEIKEYWGKTKGGSKMSDAVYECNLVGRELREFEERSCSRHAIHVVFVDGAEQWSHRRSDLARFVDLLYQGFIDCLIVGREVETKWKLLLEEIL